MLQQWPCKRMVVSMTEIITVTVMAVLFFAQYNSDCHFISTFQGVYFPLLLPCSFGEGNAIFKPSAEAGITMSVWSQCIGEGWQQLSEKLKKNLGFQPCLLLKKGLPSLEVISPLLLSNIFFFFTKLVWVICLVGLDFVRCFFCLFVGLVDLGFFPLLVLWFLCSMYIYSDKWKSLP